MDGLDPISELITSYNELNSCAIEELAEEPSPLEFMRYVSRNTPFVVRKAAAEWEAVTSWSTSFLLDAMADQTVNVAVTPNGNADSPTELKDEGTVFAKPCEEDQPFSNFLQYVVEQENGGSSSSHPEVRYAQTQNDNLRHEYAGLFSHVQRDIPFARVALQTAPDAINLWIGNSRSVTALHRDNYENIYLQVLGRKHFVLLSPVCHACVNERSLRPATYRRRDGSEDLELRLDDEGGGEEHEHIPFATWNPDMPGEKVTEYSHLAKPVRVTLDPGDMLYLPCMWYHKVSQSCSEEGICVAVNYWYDMDFSGPHYPLCSFARSVSLQRMASKEL